MPVRKKAAPAPRQAVVAAPSTALVKPGSWREHAKQSVTRRKIEQQKLSKSGGNYISFKGGDINIGGVPMPNPFPCIILATQWQRCFYGNPYSPDVSATPDCFSFDKQAPHEASPVPQADACAVCPRNEFGSSSNGKGKACPESTRIAILAADVLKNPDSIGTAPIATGSISFLNSQTYANFAGALFDEESPEYTFLTMLSNKAGGKAQYAVNFDAKKLPEDDAVLDALAARAREAEKLLAAPYQPIEEATPAKAAPPPRRGRKF